MSYPITTIGALGAPVTLSASQMGDILSAVNPFSPDFIPWRVARAGAQRAASTVDKLEKKIDPIPVAVELAGGDPTWGYTLRAYALPLGITLGALVAAGLAVETHRRRKAKAKKRT